MRMAAVIALLGVMLLGAAGCKCMECKKRADGRRMTARCPMCSSTMQTGDRDAAMGRMGTDRPACAHCGAMMGAKMSSASPCMLMAMKDELKLTQEQMDKLTAIQKGCIEQTEALLTADQKAMIEKMKSTPPTMMEKCPMHKGEMK